MQINSSFSKSKERIEIKEIFAQSDIYKFDKALKSSFFHLEKPIQKEELTVFILIITCMDF